MRYFFFPLLFSIFLLLGACSKDAKVKSKDYPYLLTGPVTDITDQSVNFNCEVLGTGNYTNLECGFLWDSIEPFNATANKIVASSGAGIGSYTKTVDYSLVPGRELYVRAYLLTDNLMVYGNTRHFTCNGGKPASIESFSPAKGYVNTAVTISGQNFGRQTDKIRVFFGTTPAVVDSVTGNRIYTRVPEINQDIECLIRVESAGKQSQSVTTFRAFTYWKRIAFMPGEFRYGAVSFILGDTAYVGMGLKPDGTALNDFWAYEALSNTWTRKPDFPGTARGMAAGFSDGIMGFAGFGIVNQKYLTDLWMFNPQRNTWARTADLPGILSYGDACFEINGKAYFVNQNSFLVYTIYGSFDPQGIFPGDYRHLTAGFSSADKGYLFAGRTPGNVYMKDLWEYTPAFGSWKKLSELPGKKYRDSPVGFCLNSRLFMGLGRYGSALNDFYEYVPATDEWKLLESFPGGGRVSAVAFTLGSKAYIGTGSNNGSGAYSDFYEFDPFKQ